MILATKLRQLLRYFSQHCKNCGRHGGRPVRHRGRRGPVDRIQLPGGLTFQYTHGPDDLRRNQGVNLEQRGSCPISAAVTLDDRGAKLKAKIRSCKRPLPSWTGKRPSLPDDCRPSRGSGCRSKAEDALRRDAKDYVLTFASRRSGKAEIKTDCATAAACTTRPPTNGVPLEAPSRAPARELARRAVAKTVNRLDGGRVIHHRRRQPASRPARRQHGWCLRRSSSLPATGTFRMGEDPRSWTGLRQVQDRAKSRKRGREMNKYLSFIMILPPFLPGAATNRRLLRCLFHQ